MPLSRVPTAQLTGDLSFRNRIINGDMRIDQRNNGASVSVTAGTAPYTLDRWIARSPIGGGTFTVQRSTTAPASFKNSLLCTVTSAASVGASDIYFLQQRIEGFNVADLGFGAAGASSVTVSFWVRSSLTGNFGASVGNNVDQSYPFSFTINAANTFEQKTVTIPGSTTGTWLTDSGVGLLISFSLGAGSSVTGTANTWANYPYAPTSSVNLIATNGATFYITGVQLEAGTVASPFERRDYGRELQMCQRYCYQINGSAGGAVGFGGMVNTYTSTRAFGTWSVAVPMRTSPTISFANAIIYTTNLASSATITAIFVYQPPNSESREYYVEINTSGSLTGICMPVFMSASGAFIRYSAEL